MFVTAKAELFYKMFSYLGNVDLSPVIRLIIDHGETLPVVTLAQAGLLPHYDNNISSLKIAIQSLCELMTKFLYVEKIFNSVAKRAVPALSKLLLSVKTHWQDETLVKDTLNVVHLLVDNSIDEEIIIIVEQGVMKLLSVIVSLHYQAYSNSLQKQKRQALIHKFVESLNTIGASENDIPSIKNKLQPAVKPLLRFIFDYFNKLCSDMKNAKKVMKSHQNREVNGLINMVIYAKLKPECTINDFMTLINNNFVLNLIKLNDKALAFDHVHVFFTMFVEKLVTNYHTFPMDERSKMLPTMLAAIKSPGLQINGRYLSKHFPCHHLGHKKVDDMNTAEVCIFFVLGYSQGDSFSFSDEYISLLNKHDVFNAVKDFALANSQSHSRVDTVVSVLGSSLKKNNAADKMIGPVKEMVPFLLPYLKNLKGWKKSAMPDRYNLIVSILEFYCFVFCYNSKDVIEQIESDNNLFTELTAFLRSNQCAKDTLLSRRTCEILYQFLTRTGSKKHAIEVLQCLSVLKRYIKRAHKEENPSFLGAGAQLVLAALPSDIDDPELNQTVGELLIDVLVKYRFSIDQPIEVFRVLWETIRNDRHVPLTRYIIHAAVNEDFDRIANQDVRTLIPDKSLIFNFLSKKITPLLDSGEIVNNYYLELLTKDLVIVAEKSSSDEELYALEDLVSPLMWLLNDVDGNEEVIKNVKKYISILH